METELFCDLRCGDRFQFADYGTVYTYSGNGWYGRPYSGGPWCIVADDKRCRARVIVVERKGKAWREFTDSELREFIDGCHKSRDRGYSFEAACRELNGRQDARLVSQDERA